MTMEQADRDRAIEILEHHGIKGQKWGKRNGPPYPLDEEDKSAAEKKVKKSDASSPKVDKLRKKLAEADDDLIKKVRKLESYEDSKYSTVREVNEAHRTDKHFQKLFKDVVDARLMRARIRQELADEDPSDFLYEESKRMIKEERTYRFDAAESILEHHGILKQKWGVRRGPPYPLTPEAKRSKGKTDYSQMTDEELQKVVNRIRLEQQLASLTRTPKKQSAATRIMKNVLEKSVTDIATQATKYALGEMVNRAAGKKIVKTTEEKKKKKDK